MDRKLVWGGGAVVAAAIVAVSAALYNKKSPENLNEDEPDLSVNEVVTIFGELHRRMHQTMRQIMQNIKMIQQQIDPNQLQLIILQEFEKQLLQHQEEVFKQHNADEEDVKHSTWYWIDHKDPEVKGAVTRLQELYTTFGGKIEADVPDELDVHTMCQVLEEYCTTMIGIQKRLSMSGGQITEMQQMKMQEETNAVLEKYGLTPMTFQAACNKFKSDPVFQKKAMEMTEGQGVNA